MTDTKDPAQPQAPSDIWCPIGDPPPVAPDVKDPPDSEDDPELQEFLAAINASKDPDSDFIALPQAPAP